MNIVVGISGGVDSAVAALLLKQQGHHVVGLFMKNWEEDDIDGHCAAAEDLKEAGAVCARIGIELRTANFSTEYWDRVFTHFLAEHRAGRTPNPDVLCNSEIKFKAFLEHALMLGAERIATGHYARIIETGGEIALACARDAGKDQTYFLHGLSSAQLRKSLFPLADLPKSEVRALARAHDLPNFDRKDSTGICFIGERNYKAFLARFLDGEPGDMRTLTGDWKGRHDGLPYYTLGQRHGLKLGGAGAPWYVVAKNGATNTLYIEQGARHPALYHDALIASPIHWIRGAPPTTNRLTAKTRYRQTDQPCRWEPVREGARVTFDTPQRALTPGQSVVFYDGDECLGGAIIQTAMNTGIHHAAFPSRDTITTMATG